MYQWLQKGHILKPKTPLNTSKDIIKNDSKEIQTTSRLVLVKAARKVKTMIYNVTKTFKFLRINMLGYLHLEKNNKNSNG